jgi:hypothetical protein
MRDFNSAIRAVSAQLVPNPFAIAVKAPHFDASSNEIIHLLRSQITQNVWL